MSAARRDSAILLEIEDDPDQPDGFGGSSASGANPQSPAVSCDAAVRRALAAAAAEARVHEAICCRVKVSGLWFWIWEI